MSGPAVIEVAAAIIRRGETVLLARRRANGHLPHLWEFPGGKREPGETLEQCLARELREELGIGVRVGRLAREILHAYADRTVRLFFFECELLDGQPQPLHCQDCRWVPKSELTRYDFPPADTELIEWLMHT
ncbi:MAG: 8-oxo-dGTP diphosphatase MutT [Verrucomicrobiae bacterium]|nr:8-oxo-dGTP diphosphatase MutT [Verrucomicrobiae bacterium]